VAAVFVGGPGALPQDSSPPRTGEPYVACPFDPKPAGRAGVRAGAHPA
jgi:hypothetical protein